MTNHSNIINFPIKNNFSEFKQIIKEEDVNFSNKPAKEVLNQKTIIRYNRFIDLQIAKFNDSGFLKFFGVEKRTLSGGRKVERNEAESINEFIVIIDKYTQEKGKSNLLDKAKNNFIEAKFIRNNISTGIDINQSLMIGKLKVEARNLLAEYIRRSEGLLFEVPYWLKTNNDLTNNTKLNKVAA